MGGVTLGAMREAVQRLERGSKPGGRQRGALAAVDRALAAAGAVAAVILEANPPPDLICPEEAALLAALGLPAAKTERDGG